MSNRDDRTEGKPNTPQWNRYQMIILDIFERHHKGDEEFEFERDEIAEAAQRCARSNGPRIWAT